MREFQSSLSIKLSCIKLVYSHAVFKLKKHISGKSFDQEELLNVVVAWLL